MNPTTLPSPPSKLPSHTEENYLKAIYKLAEAQPDVAGVSTNRIAAALDTRAASVTDMLRRLADKGLLAYERYRGVQRHPLAFRVVARAFGYPLDGTEGARRRFAEP